jgi:hypothetical protein
MKLVGRRPMALLALVLLGLACSHPQGTAASSPPQASEGSFLVKPYLQLGDRLASGASGDLVILWQTVDADADWSVESRSLPDGSWTRAEAPRMQRVAVPGIAPHRVYHARLQGLPSGASFGYRLRKGGEIAFAAEARAARKAIDQPYRVVAFGDCARGTPAQKAIAFRAHELHPDFVLIPGDIVYDRGRVSEYREKFWPVYNAEEPSASVGAPLLRSTLFVAAPGNHDIGSRDLEKFPDGLAYYLYWDQPLNGPEGREGGSLVPAPKGPEANLTAFRSAAGAAYPRMANFSFDYGNAHWTVLDSNSYVDWTDPDLRAWVARDLAEARDAAWRFVVYHHPGFNSAKKHFEQQQMRLIAEVFEAGKVDLVFNGHVHNYQRSYPLTFVPETARPDASDKVAGRWTLDKSFDGRTRTRPQGVIYLITGAGGADLYNPEQQEDPSSWQEFTFKFQSKVHSLTVMDVRGRELQVRQVTAEGDELDRFVVTK